MARHLRKQGGLPLPYEERERGFRTLGCPNPSPDALRASTPPYGRGEQSMWRVCRTK
jgi:hypothetical protein